MAKKKSTMEKIAETVDHIIHPDHKSEPEKVEVENPDTSDLKADYDPVKEYENHPKFDKFKKGSN